MQLFYGDVLIKTLEQVPRQAVMSPSLGMLKPAWQPRSRRPSGAGLDLWVSRGPCPPQPSCSSHSDRLFFATSCPGPQTCLEGTRQPCLLQPHPPRRAGVPWAPGLPPSSQSNRAASATAKMLCHVSRKQYLQTHSKAPQQKWQTSVLWKCKHRFSSSAKEIPACIPPPLQTLRAVAFVLQKVKVFIMKLLYTLSSEQVG